MSYVLPRLFALALLWALTCALMAVMGPLPASACYLAAMCWAVIGGLYFLSTRRLRLDSSLALGPSGVFDSDNLD